MWHFAADQKCINLILVSFENVTKQRDVETLQMVLVIFSDFVISILFIKLLHLLPTAVGFFHTDYTVM